MKQPSGTIESDCCPYCDAFDNEEHQDSCPLYAPEPAEWEEFPFDLEVEVDVEPGFDLEIVEGEPDDDADV